jgi:predicted nucleic acid-binding protein
MNVFLDTNVLLDVIFDRGPFYAESAKVWALAETEQVRGSVSSLSFANIFYLVRRAKGRKAAQRAMNVIRDAFTIIPMDAQITNQAIDADMDDFEDATQFFSALRANATTMVTRNAKHFPTDSIAIQTPTDFLTAHFPE